MTVGPWGCDSGGVTVGPWGCDSGAVTGGVTVGP